MPIQFHSAQFRTGDLIVHYAYWPDENGRPNLRNPINRLSAAIAEVGRGYCSHIGMIDMVNDAGVTIPYVVEMWPPVGRSVPLIMRVRSHPNTVHWFRVPDSVTIQMSDDEEPLVHHYDRYAAIGRMREYIGVKYGFDTIGRDYLASSWGRWVSRMPYEDEIVDWQPVCSTAALDALQAGFSGWDLVRHLHTAAAQPEDVARIAFLQDMGGLIL